MKLKKLVREMSYYPTCFDDPDDKAQKQADRIKVNFNSYPSGLQISMYEKVVRNGKEFYIDHKYVDIMLAHVESIENLQIGDDKIDTAVILCDYEDSRLFDLMRDIKNKLFDESEVLTEKEN